MSSAWQVGGLPAMHTRLVIPGSIYPKGSMRSLGRGRMIDNSKLGIAWRKSAVNFLKPAAEALPIEIREWDDEVVIFATYVVFPFKKPTRVWPMNRRHGDVDKYDRNLHDALEQSGFIVDDARVVGHWSSKRFPRDIEQPHTLVDIFYGSGFDIATTLQNYVEGNFA